MTLRDASAPSAPFDPTFERVAEARIAEVRDHLAIPLFHDSPEMHEAAIRRGASSIAALGAASFANHGQSTFIGVFKQSGATLWKMRNEARAILGGERAFQLMRALDMAAGAPDLGSLAALDMAQPSFFAALGNAAAISRRHCISALRQLADIKRARE